MYPDVVEVIHEVAVHDDSSFDFIMNHQASLVFRRAVFGSARNPKRSGFRQSLFGGQRSQVRTTMTMPSTSIRDVFFDDDCLLHSFRILWYDYRGTIPNLWE